MNSNRYTRHCRGTHIGNVFGRSILDSLRVETHTTTATAEAVRCSRLSLLSNRRICYSGSSILRPNLYHKRIPSGTVLLQFELRCPNSDYNSSGSISGGSSGSFGNSIVFGIEFDDPSVRSVPSRCWTTGQDQVHPLGVILRHSAEALPKFYFSPKTPPVTFAAAGTNATFLSR